MFSKTEFNPSKALLMQPLKELTSPQKKRRFSNIGTKLTPSNSSSKRPNTYLHTLSTMALPLLPEPLTTDTSQQEPSRMLFVGMPVRQVIMFPEDSDGIVTDYLWSTKSINNSELSQKLKSTKWESINTTLTVEES
jgi:hypothetical protein